MEDGSILGNFVVRDDMNILAEFGEHRHPRLGRNAVGSHEDSLAVAPAQLGFHGLGVSVGVVRSVEINDARLFPGALLDAGHAFFADELAIAVERQERSLALFDGLGTVEVFFDGRRVTFHRREADAKLAISREQPKTNSFQPVRGH